MPTPTSTTTTTPSPKPLIADVPSYDRRRRASFIAEALLRFKHDHLRNSSNLEREQDAIITEYVGKLNHYLGSSGGGVGVFTYDFTDPFDSGVPVYPWPFWRADQPDDLLVNNIEEERTARSDGYLPSRRSAVLARIPVPEPEPVPETSSKPVSAAPAGKPPVK